ncbi:MAG: glutaredoxin [Spirochaeta sp.]|jgi:arsenate reductase|nr:glutaredoxin [Spirochaeta sp.]
MTPQIIGSKKSRGFRACERYCRERQLSYQHRDPIEKPLSPGELEAILRFVREPADLIDTTAKAYTAKGLAWMDYDPVEEIQENPALLRTPIVRSDAGIAVDPDVATLDHLFER